jgi:hypothetical protein
MVLPFWRFLQLLAQACLAHWTTLEKCLLPTSAHFRILTRMVLIEPWPVEAKAFL